MVHFARPLQKTPQIAALSPEKFPEFNKPDLLHLKAAVGLNAPEQIRASPRRQTMAASRVPHEAKDGEHGISF